MKILTKEEEQAHYNATLKGGITGGLLGLLVGGAVVYGANARFHTFRSLTLPMKTFLVTSSSTFAAIVNADSASRKYEIQRDPQRQYRDRASRDLEEVAASESTLQRAKDWGREHRYPIVTASWVASMGIALGLVGRNPYLSRAQKLVQARVYAQGLTLAVLVATAAFEVGDASKGKGRWETVKILDPNDPEHKHIIEKRIHHEAYAGEDLWRDMVAAEERKISERKAAVQEEEANSAQKHDKGKANKDKIVSQHKTAGKPVRDDAEEHEAENMQAQAEKHGAAKTSTGGEPKVKDRK